MTLGQLMNVLLAVPTSYDDMNIVVKCGVLELWPNIVAVPSTSEAAGGCRAIELIVAVPTEYGDILRVVEQRARKSPADQ